MRIVFLGTPEFAVPALAAVADAHEVVLVVAQPDRPKGRGRALAEPPVKTEALARQLVCMQVESPNRPHTIAALGGLAPDLFVVVAYGAILSPALLAVPRLGCVNLHASLLPRHRGASPIQAAILAGDKVTGNTTMWMAEGLDTGDIVLQQETPIAPDESAGELSARLSVLGASLLAETLAAIERGDAPRRAQPNDGATVTKKIKKADGRLDFTGPAHTVHDRARAMTPWPGALAGFGDEIVRLERTRVLRDAGRNGAPGTILGPAADGGLEIACGEGAIEVRRVRPAGRNEMEAAAWWRGLRPTPGSDARFTTPEAEER